MGAREGFKKVPKAGSDARVSKNFQKIAKQKRIVKKKSLDTSAWVSLKPTLHTYNEIP